MRWAEVKQMMRDTGVDVVGDTDTTLALSWPPPSGRTVHVMAVYQGAIGDLGEWIGLIAMVCQLSDTSLEEISALNAELFMGALVVNPPLPDEPDGQRLVTLRHSLRIDELQVEEFMYALKPIVLNADSLRERINGQEQR
jgi:hypothetical protein